jgi:phosphoribosylaminoimidazolecarboxamide formyltransferase/IMP cyclohydrolase
MTKKRALISVYDKQGILEFARFLETQNIEIISTGGTFKFLKENKVNVIDISTITKFPEMLDGRVKTLHPNIHGGILAIRDNKEHTKQIDKHHIKPIDFIIVNLYPFFDKVKTDLTEQQKIEFIDIGGPSMLRSAAKNFKDVVVVCDQTDYQSIMSEMQQNGNISTTTRKALAAKVFNLTSAYDASVACFLNEQEYPSF